MFRSLAVFAVVVFPGCAAVHPLDACPVAEIRSAIDAELQNGVKATRDEDIERYMDGIPPDYRIVEDDGSITDREALRAHALQSWAVIESTKELIVRIDGIEVSPSCREARVMTSQRWERIMRRPDDSGTDTVLTTQMHEELWREAGGRWYNYEIKELGGAVFVNGEPYTP